ncbi:MAG: hypothetical protein K2O44_06315 [Clostridia bacterium]|nr:hypothetical protein [Clostridia bacterium]
MKRKFLAALICAAAICAAGALAACSSGQECDHTWNVGVVTTQATCSATGLKTYTCTTCGETKTEVIQKTEHPHSDGWLHNDTEHWQAATCEHDTEQVNAGAHVWDEGTVVTAATCLKTGLMRYTCICGLTRTEIVPKTEHPYAEDWITDDNGHWHVCTMQGCGQLSVKAAHNWNEGEITTPATCLAEGVKTYTCTDCKKTRTETVAIVNHSYGDEWSSDENGHYHACTTNGCTEEIDRDTHTFGEWTKSGQVVKICSECKYEKPAPFMASGIESVNITVGGGEKSGVTVFTMGFNYYTISYAGSTPIKVTCDFSDREGNPFSYKYTLSADSQSFTVRLPDRSIACLFIESEAETAFQCELNLSISGTAPGHVHSYSDEWSTDGEQHWHACTGEDCEDAQDVGIHEFNGGNVCTVCGYDKTATD